MSGFCCTMLIAFFISLPIYQTFLVGSGICEKGSADLWMETIILFILTAMGWGWMCLVYAVMARLTYPYMEWSDFGLGLYLCFSWIFSLIVCCYVCWQHHRSN